MNRKDRRLPDHWNAVVGRTFDSCWASMIDLLLLAIVALVTWMVASEGPWGAGITLISVILAGLFAMNFFEPLATFLSLNVLSSYTWQHYWDIISLLGLFSGAVFGLRAIGDKLFPTFAEVSPLVYQLFRWGFGLAAGYVTMAILLTALHTAPLPREFLGFAPERNNFFLAAAPDRQWLAFTQYVSEKSLRTLDLAGNPRLFDGTRFERIPGDRDSLMVGSSFPIKYAARRELYVTGGTATPATTLPPAPTGGQPPPNGAPTGQPVPVQRPSGSGAGGF